MGRKKMVKGKGGHSPMATAKKSSDLQFANRGLAGGSGAGSSTHGQNKRPTKFHPMQKHLERDHGGGAMSRRWDQGDYDDRKPATKVAGINERQSEASRKHSGVLDDSLDMHANLKRKGR